jgi:hypothetical protein
MEMNSFGNKSFINMTHPQGNIGYINELNESKFFKISHTSNKIIFMDNEVCLHVLTCVSLNDHV